MIKSDDKSKANVSSVGIIGCGWLGKPLALSLKNQRISVLATSGQQCNVEKLLEQGIDAQQLVLPSTTEQLVQHDVFKQQSLVIAITPQFKRARTDYGVKVAQLIEAAVKVGAVQRIILLSSTSVYQGLEGVVDENTPLNSVELESMGKTTILNAAEQSVLNFHLQGNVLRLAGLVGPARHPGKFLLAKRTLKDATTPVNLIHQQDAVGLILSLLASSFPKGIFNGVSDTHVSKATYYKAAAKSLGVELPTFDKEKKLNSTRIVSGDKAKQQLGYTFVFPDLLAWLNTHST